MSARTLLLAATWLALTALALPRPAAAGGGPENVLLVVDPGDADALAVANHYIAARRLPASNVLYLAPNAPSYQAFASFQLPAVLGSLAQRGLVDHIDYVVTAGRAFYIPAPGLVKGYVPPMGGAEQCPIGRFSITGAWTLAYSAEEILGATLAFSEPNRYYANNDSPTAFDGRATWLNGRPSTAASARRYLLGFQLGYSGERGNTPAETMAMIDRSVAADGSRPAGTFYFMRNGDIRSTTRTPYFQAAIDGLARLGGRGEVIDGSLPAGKHDALGILAGNANLDIAGADLGLLPGAWADHLTSFAATFDEGGQTKLSPWIPKGASGSMGTVEEPCVFGSASGGSYREKFPHPRLATFYYQGLSLGEALFRATPFTPFQGMFYGDPLTKPFAISPVVTLPEAPTAPVAGVLTLRPEATTAAEGAKVAELALYVDGQRLAAAAAGQPLTLDTARLPDGPRDLRVVATDDSAARVQGAWRGSLTVANHPARSVSLAATPLAAGPGGGFAVTAKALGELPLELQLLKDGRILAAGPGAVLAPARPLAADSLGTGPATLLARARYADGGLATSAPLTLRVAPHEPGGPAPAEPGPLAFGYHLELAAGEALLLDLPALGAGGEIPEREILTGPTQAIVSQDRGTFLLLPAAEAHGEDALSFRARAGSLPSDPATVTIRYCAPPVITRQPRDLGVCRGETAVLELGATGEGLVHQWYQDGRLLPGATGARLTIPKVTGAQLGEYTATVASRCGARWLEARSEPARLAWDTSGRCVPGRAYLPWAGRGAVLAR